MDWTSRPGDVADPWYTGDFDTTYNDSVEGLEAFLSFLEENGYLITEDYSKWLNDAGFLNCLVDYPYADHKEIEKLRDNLMSKYYFSFAYIGKTFLANLNWVEFKRVMRGGTQYIAFRLKKAFNKDDNLE